MPALATSETVQPARAGRLRRIQAPGDLITGNNTPATDAAFDYRQLLGAALQARGANYVVAVTSDSRPRGD